jgi:hypothetical protein
MCEDHQARDQSRNNLAVEVLQKMGVLRLSAFGYSMLPSLYPGDIVTVRQASLSEMRPGDVVLYIRDGRLFLHRNLKFVQTTSGSALVTRGDSMPHVDAPVSSSELLGRVVKVERRGKPQPLPPCTPARRIVGLLLGYSARLRSLALRWHKPPARTAGQEFVGGEALR